MRETGTVQQVAQLHDRYMMMIMPQLHLVGHFRILHHDARKHEYQIYNIYAEFTDGSRYVDTVVCIYIYIYIP
jgi:hypothetical protein